MGEVASLLPQRLLEHSGCPSCRNFGPWQAIVLVYSAYSAVENTQCVKSAKVYTVFAGILIATVVATAGVRLIQRLLAFVKTAY